MDDVRLRTITDIIRDIETWFNEGIVVPSARIYKYTGLGEESFPNLYYSITKDCVIKLDDDGKVSMYNGSRHTTYIRIRDASKEQVYGVIDVRKPWKEATIRLADIELDQAYERLRVV